MKEFVVLVEAETPELKPELCDHWTVYAVVARPVPPSVEAVQDQTGAVVLDGVVVEGVPGVVGAVVSITSALLVARFVVGTKLVMALAEASAIVPLIDDTVRSDVVSPAWTV